MEVLNVDVFVRSCFSLAPKEETFLCGHFFHGNILDSEPKNDGPNHTESHFNVSVDNF